MNSNRSGIYLGSNSCYLNTAFQLLASIDEFVDIFINEQDFSNIYSFNYSNDVINLESLFKHIKEIISNIVKNTKNEISKYYKYIVESIFPPEYGKTYQSQRQTEEFVKLLYNLFNQVRGTNTTIIAKIKRFIDVIEIDRTLITRCVDSQYRIPINTQYEKVGLFDLNEYYKENGNLQNIIEKILNKPFPISQIIENCGTLQQLHQFKIANINKGKTSICRPTDKDNLCIKPGEYYFHPDNDTDKITNENDTFGLIGDVNIAIEKLLTIYSKDGDFEKAIQINIPYGKNIYGMGENKFEFKFKKYIIINFPSTLNETTYNTILYKIDYDNELIINKQKYNLIGSVQYFGTGKCGHYVYNQFNDNTVFEYNDNKVTQTTKNMNNTVLVLYKRQEHIGKPSDDIISIITISFYYFINYIIRWFTFIL